MTIVRNLKAHCPSGIGVRTSVVLGKHMFLQEKKLSSDKCCFRKTYVFTRKENYHQIKRLMLSTEWTLGPKTHLMRKEYTFYKSKSKTRNISYFTKWSA